MPQADIIQQLRKDILPLQGYKRRNNAAAVPILPQAITNSFPNHQFPLAAVHEFLFTDPEKSAATTGFLSGILASLLQNGNSCIWIGNSQTIFPPAFKSFGISADNLIFIDVKNNNDILWVTEEALKCNGLAAVVAEMRKLDFVSSRRLQLAVEQSGVTGFILRNNSPGPDITACISRWAISSLPARIEEGMPGVGFPRWKVELLKIRNGLPGQWDIVFREGSFSVTEKINTIRSIPQKKAG